MSGAKRGAFQPVILTANDLASGVPLVWTAAGDWVRDATAACLFASAETADAALAAAQAQPGRVVAPYLTEAVATPDGPRPTIFRERIRLTGPTLQPIQG